MPVYKADDVVIQKGQLSLNAMRKSGELTDFDIILGISTFKCHKVVIASRSDFLKLKVGSSDSYECKHSKIPGPILEEVLSFIYTSSVDIRDDNVYFLINLATELHLDDLKTLCADHLISITINERNCLLHYVHSTKYNLSALKNKCIDYSQKNFQQISKQSSFLDLGVDELCIIIKGDDLAVADERGVLDAVRRWIFHLEEERLPFVGEALSQVRLPMININFNEYKKLSREKMFQLAEGQYLLDQAMQYRDSPDTRWWLQSNSTRPRPSTGTHEVLVAVTLDSLDSEEQIIKWNQKQNKWSRANKYGRGDHSFNCIATYQDGFFYMSRNAFKFVDVRQGSNRIFKKRSFYTCSAGIVVQNGLFVIGGVPLDGLVERFDLTKECWEDMPPLPIPVAAPCVFTVNEKIYVLGGISHNEHGPVRQIQVFSLEDYKWTLLENTLLDDTMGTTATCYDGNVYVLSNSGTVYLFDLGSMKMTSTWQIKHDCTFASMTVFQGQIIVNAGQTCVSYQLSEGKPLTLMNLPTNYLSRLLTFNLLTSEADS